jgi:hypothetical protein
MMVAYAYYAIEWVSPYAMLGMVHVLEGLSAGMAGQAAEALGKRFEVEDDKGIRYLRSHGSLDVAHTAFFETLVNDLDETLAGDVIVDAAETFYFLYGDIFRDLQSREREVGDAA